MLAPSVLLAVAVMAAAPVAREEGAPAGSLAVLAVAPPPGPGAELGGLCRDVRDAVGSRGGTVLPADEVRRRMAGRSGGSTVSELERAYLGAAAAQRGGDLTGAARTLRAVLDDLERLPETEGSPALWEQAVTRLAYVQLSLGFRSECRDLLGRLLRAQPGARPDPEFYPPSFLRQADEIRAELRRLPRRTLTVTTGGRPARVYVEGHPAGAAPLSLQLPPGSYRVSAAVDELVVSAGTVELDQKDRTVAIDVTLAEALRPGVPGLAVADAARPAAAVSAGATLGVERILAVSSVLDRDVRYLVASLIDVGRGQLTREGRIRLTDWTPAPGAIAALTDFVVAGAPSTHVIVQPPPRPPDLAANPAAVPAAQPAPSPVAVALAPAAPRPAARGATPLGWTAFGAAVLAVGAGALAGYEALAASGKYSDARKLAGPDGRLAPGADPARYNALVRDGDTATNVARIGAGAAVGLAATSAVLGYVNYRRTGEFGPFRF